MKKVTRTIETHTINSATVTMENDKNFGETMNETREDVERDGKPQTFDELLERVEG